MEIRANHVLIGAFSLGIFIAAFLFVLWLGGVETRETTTYEILFEDSVSGLSTGAAVQYKGIQVGQVTNIDLDSLDTNKVRVRIEINSDTPIKVDTVANLEAQLLTGVAIIQISGGKPGSAKLEAKADQDFPVITSQRSSLQELFTGAPDLIAQANVLVSRLSNIVNTENQQSITNILNDVEELTNSIASRSDDIGSIIDNLNGMSDDLSTASDNIAELTKNLNAVAENANTLVDEDARVLIAEASQAARNISEVAASIDNIVEDNADAINDFSHQGLAQLGRFVSEARALVQTLDRVATKIDSDPAAFFFGNQAAEYNPE